MGPRSFDRGERRGGDECGGLQPRFNGAAVIRPRRVVDGCVNPLESGDRRHREWLRRPRGFGGYRQRRPRPDFERTVWARGSQRVK